ncbi:MAG: putative lipoprotein YbbD precursor [Chloroflexi bacterium ADurb.Bin325]|nr:MAG: putative lipoprotein YbbD precursor [Chloroflexi bacterium ADurb.Bin325]
MSDTTTMRRRIPLLLVLIWLFTLWLPPIGALQAAPAGEGQAQTRPTEPPPPSPTLTPTPVDPRVVLDQMSVADKVGQLFLITFEGASAPADSDVAVLVRDYRVGGVVLLPENGNFRNAPAGAPPADAAADASPVAAEAPRRTTPEQIAALADELQALALSPPLAIPLTATITNTAALPEAAAAEPESATLPGPVFAEDAGIPIPLFIALDWLGDDGSFFSGAGGFTPLPSAMAIAATWSTTMAEQVGRVVGHELSAAGVNMLLGPTLDVLDVPRPGGKGDLDTRTFGGDPFWVGQMGKAFIRGVQSGSNNQLLTVAEHFPGQGGSDRRPEEEVATVQKSLEQLRQIELAPFAAVTAGNDLRLPGIAPAMMTAHIRYRGFQGNIRELTPPISLAPQLQDLMELPEFAPWRAAGGVLVSDALGVPALRRYYDPTLTNFPHRQVAQHAFLAGNDLLYLGRFALTDQWSDQITAIKETILFFQEKYQTDAGFRARVDASVERIIRLKLDIYAGRWQPTAEIPFDLAHDLGAVDQQVGRSVSVTQAVARASVTLIYPGRDELADRMPSAPLANEKILIFTDTRTVRECAECDARPLIGEQAIEEIIMRLYGPGATRQVRAEQVRSLSFTDLNGLLTGAGPASEEVERAIAEAQWIIFGQLDYNPGEYPDSTALRTFLARRSDSLRDKRLVVLAFSAPYYLDTTEISKLTAYFGVYSHTTPFLEAAVRALFREFTPAGSPPVTVTGINYELIRQLEPAPGQIITLAPVGSGDVISGSIQVGSQIELETGVILDRKGNPVPDGTPVEFHLQYPTESLALAPKSETTVAGRARTIVPLDRTGELWITVQAGDARDSTRIVLKVGGDAPGSIATVVPTATPQPTATATPTPVPSPTASLTPEPSPTPSAASSAGSNQPRVNLPAFLYALIGTLLSGGLAFMVMRRGIAQSNTPYAHLIEALVAALWAGAAAWIAYLLYAVGWLPGSTEWQSKGYAWAAGAVTFVGGALSLLWTARRPLKG